MTFDDLMERSREWDRDVEELMRDHALFRERLANAVPAPLLSPSRAKPTSCLGASRFDQLSQSPTKEAGAANNRSGDTQ